MEERTFNDAMKDCMVPIGLSETGIEFAVDLRKMDQNTWIGRDGRRHDVTDGPCYCGSWHDPDRFVGDGHLPPEEE